eukprot:3921000-Rhodomonas_salina.4
MVFEVGYPTKWPKWCNLDSLNKKVFPRASTHACTQRLCCFAGGLLSMCALSCGMPDADEGNTWKSATRAA